MERELRARRDAAVARGEVASLAWDAAVVQFLVDRARSPLPLVS